MGSPGHYFARAAIEGAKILIGLGIILFLLGN